MKSSGPPAGHHPAEFVGIKPFEGGEQSYGPTVSLAFKVTEGDYANEEIFIVCSAKLLSRSKLGA